MNELMSVALREHLEAHPIPRERLRELAREIVADDEDLLEALARVYVFFLDEDDVLELYAEHVGSRRQLVRPELLESALALPQAFAETATTIDVSAHMEKWQRR